MRLVGANLDSVVEAYETLLKTVSDKRKDKERAGGLPKPASTAA